MMRQDEDVDAQLEGTRKGYVWLLNQRENEWMC